MNVTFDDDYDIEKETADDENRSGTDKYDEEYKYGDTIENEEYDKGGMLPQPTVSTLRRETKILPYPNVNHGNSQNTNIKENMNVISSFRLKQE